MRVMLMIKGDPQPGAAPSEELLAAMGSYNDELKQAGVLRQVFEPEPSDASSSGALTAFPSSVHEPKGDVLHVKGLT